MQRLENVYGVHTWLEWNRRLDRKDVRRLHNLADTKEPAGCPREAFDTPIEGYRELMSVVHFLTVMNKTLTPLYRGQGSPHRLLPSLFRPTWTTPDGDQSRLQNDRAHYWNELQKLGTPLYDHLDREEGLPRWRHMKYRSQGQWAVIQHYELWPTPFLDFSSSLRVAASFAFGFGDEYRQTGFLYVVGVEVVCGDLMELPEKPPDDTPDNTLALRLNSVCPPGAQRPHLQEGYLVGRHPFNESALTEPDASDVSACLIATIPIQNTCGDFWSADFPAHTKDSLLPKEDEVRKGLRALFEYRTSDGRTEIVLPQARSRPITADS